MQRGIDSFFKRVQKSDSNEEEKGIKGKKRKKVIISSDEEEETESPQVSKGREHKKTRPNEEKTTPKERDRKIDSSKTKVTPKELKKVNPNDLFGGETKRIQAAKPPKPKDTVLVELSDEEIDKSLMDIDVDAVKEKSSHKKTPKKKAENGDHKSPEKKSPKKKDSAREEHKSRHQQKTPSKRNGHHLEEEKDQKKVKVSKGSEKATPSKEKITPPSKEKITPPSKEKITPPYKEKSTPSSKEKVVKKESSAKKSSAKKEKANKDDDEDLESSVVSDEDRHERKRMAAILYQKFKNRSSCLNHGCKEVPKGKPDCLAGLSFVVTGVLESLERDEAISIIKEYGGKVSSAVGKRLNYLVVGEEAGPKKLVQAEELNITILSEDGLFDLIRERSGQKPTSTKRDEEKPSTSKSSISTPAKEKPKVKTEKITPKKPKTSPDIKKESNNNERGDFKIPKIKDEIQIKQEKPPVNANMLTWVEKYKPKSVKEIIGQQGAASNVVKLTNWLSKWYSNHDGKKKLQRPNPWAKNDDGSFYKAALLSGPPGIGKTTSANLVCKELGFDVVEFNASDTRSKRLLKEEVAELLSNKSLYGFCHGNDQAVTKKHVLIMDEVDGMAGNEDRGGIQELIALIKDSSVPIICMCNDRNHQKMRSLVNYCYDLRFQRPRLEQIKACLLSILCKEKIKIETSKLEEIISASNNDIRQSINFISMLSTNKDLDAKALGENSGEKTAEKDFKLGPWDVVRKVFSADEHKRMSIYDKCDLFFHDYSLAPLFVQQNYLQVMPHGDKSQLLHKVAMTADSLSLGDLVDKRIRSRSAWTLLPTMAVFSSLMPGEYMCGHFTGQINFPGWLGKNSRATKRNRLAQEIHDHTRLRTSGSRLSIRLDYAPFLLDKIVRPLKQSGMDGVEESLNVLKEYHLLREDIDALLELTAWSGKKQAFEAVDGRVKAALTRAYNKEVMAYSYSAAAGVKKKRAEALDDEGGGLLGEEEEGAAANVDSADDKDDDLENDGLIKTKKKAAAGASKTQKATASGSKGKGASTSKAAAGAGKSKASKSRK